jgi:hypothetical protein
MNKKQHVHFWYILAALLGVVLIVAWTLRTANTEAVDAPDEESEPKRSDKPKRAAPSATSPKPKGKSVDRLVEIVRDVRKRDTGRLRHVSIYPGADLVHVVASDGTPEGTKKYSYISGRFQNVVPDVLDDIDKQRLAANLFSVEDKVLARAPIVSKNAVAAHAGGDGKLDFLMLKIIPNPNVAPGTLLWFVSIGDENFYFDKEGKPLAPAKP